MSTKKVSKIAFPLRGRWHLHYMQMTDEVKIMNIIIFLHLITAFGGASPRGEAFLSSLN